MVASKTHLAASNVGGVTMNHLSNAKLKRGKHIAGWLIVDEINMLDVQLLCDLNRLSYCGTKFLLVGDFHQYGPVNDRWAGAPLSKTLENSRLFHTLCCGNVQLMTENKRSDQRLFDFCKSICPGGSRHHLPIGDMVAAAADIMPGSLSPGTLCRLSEVCSRHLGCRLCWRRPIWCEQ